MSEAVCTDPGEWERSWDPYDGMRAVFSMADKPPVYVNGIPVPRAVAMESPMLASHRHFRADAPYSVAVSLGDADDPVQNPFLLAPPGSPPGLDLLREFFEWMHGSPLSGALRPSPDDPHVCAVPAAYMYAVADFLVFPRVARRALVFLRACGGYGCRERPECCHALAAFRSWFDVPGVPDLAPRAVPRRDALSPVPKPSPAFAASVRALVEHPKPSPDLLLYLADLEGLHPDLPELRWDMWASGDRWDHRPSPSIVAALSFWVPPPAYAYERDHHWVSKRVFFARLRRILVPALWDRDRNKLALPPSAVLAGSCLHLCLGAVPPQHTFLSLATQTGYASAEVGLFFFGPRGFDDMMDLAVRVRRPAEPLAISTFTTGHYGGMLLQAVGISRVPGGGAGTRSYLFAHVTTVAHLSGEAAPGAPLPTPDEFFRTTDHSLMAAYLEPSGRLVVRPSFVWSLVYRAALLPPHLTGEEYGNVARRMFGVPACYSRGGALVRLPTGRWPAVSERFRRAGAAGGRLRDRNPLYAHAP